MRPELRVNALVVLYDSSLSTSETIQFLFQADLAEIELQIVIWNNGPKLLDKNDVDIYLKKCKEKSIQSFIYQDTRNISLSKIYNFFINNHPTSGFYSIFDQDTLVSSTFFKKIKENKDYHVIIPLVYSPENVKKVRSPSYFNHNPFHHGEFNLGDCYGIGSCLTFSNHLASLIKLSGYTYFNENYAFYRVDTEFFTLIKKFKNLKGICVGEVYHHLSEKADPGKISQGKKLEIGYEKLLSRYYNRNKFFIKNILYCFKLKKTYQLNFFGLILLIKCAINKTHPRAYFNIANNITHDYSTQKNQYKQHMD
ncbi:MULTISPECIES: hypothetical protein [Pectobacterium]|uniref:hypothetical protein n=1 Tax=Pectobacterium TaxID=122277 RepID=UPI00057F5315|nr:MULTISPECIES: hypothetical protein [Pectobacterium]KHS95609.1 hypothetical protein RC88_10050 [Pectobacterium parvum]UVD97759.1 hypothetical protein NV347_01590 [Pectobacterium parvum]GKW41732.1 hypothetical protein PEC301879_15900 [Pectobacterium carotovorum subsp. carotovorum]